MKKINVILLVCIMILVCTSVGFAGGGKQSSNQKITLTVMDAQAYGLELSDELTSKFAKTNGINVEVQHSANNYTELLQARVNSGQIPDVFVHQVGPMVEAYAEYANDWNGDPVLDLMREDVLKDCYKDGKIFCLPWIAEVYSLIYNKKVFREAGITELPKNLKDLEAVCVKLKNHGVTPFATGFASSWILGQIASSFIAAEDQDVTITVNAITSGQKSFTDLKYFKNIFDLIDLMIKYGPDKYMEYDWERSEAALARGDAGIIHMGNWAESMFKNFNPNIEMGFIPTPITHDNTVTPKIAAGTGWAYIASKSSKNLDLAKKLVVYLLTSDDGLNFMGSGLGAIPPTKKQPSNISGQLSNDASRYVSQGLVLPWAFPKFPLGVHEFQGDTLQAYAAGDVSREEAMRLITNEWRRLR